MIDLPISSTAPSRTNRRDAHQFHLCPTAARLTVRSSVFSSPRRSRADEVFARSAETKTGILTYDTAATGSVPLQAVLSEEEIELLSSLIPSAVGSDLSPLQAVQYDLLRKWFDEGEIGWAEFLLLSAGGATSAPSPDTSYATPIVFHLVRKHSSPLFVRFPDSSRQHPFTRGSVVMLPDVVRLDDDC